METFVSVVESGSFSISARQLGVGQPAVSKTVAQLEERLGVRLLLRSTRGVTPTEAGQAFYEHARRAIEEADAAELDARGAAATLAGRLRVCAPVTLARLHIVPRLRPFLDAHPQLEIDVVLDDRRVDLREEGIDVAIRMGAQADSTMTARRIARGERVVVGTPAYFERHGEPAVPADLARHEAIVFGPRGAGTAWGFRRGSTEVSVVASGRLHTSSAEGVRAAVLAGLGLAVASTWMFAPELANGGIRRVLPQWTLPPVDLWAVYPGGRLVSAKARAFVAFVQSVTGGADDDEPAHAGAADADADDQTGLA